MEKTETELLSRLFSLEDKVAIVTGGSRGIGKMIARGFVENGARTYITSRNGDDCQVAAEELSYYGRCIALPSDLSGVDGIENFGNAFCAKEEQLDILVNNAGATWGAPFEEYPVKGWDKVFDLNLKTVFFLTQRLYPLLRASASAGEPARVINIASINGLTHPHMDNYAYSASKAGVVHLTRHLAADFAADHVNANAIAPGFFPSKMTAHLGETLEDVVSDIPCGRPGTPDDAAGAAIFLSARASAWITGITLPVDGGMIAAA